MEASSTFEELMQFLHAACFSPAPATWIQAIQRGHFTTWPGLTAEAVRKHLPKSIATAKGHMDQTRQNTRTTKTKPALLEENILRPDPVCVDGKATNFVYAAAIAVEDRTGQIHSDLTGRFPVQSSKGNNYILVVYDYDSNAILSEPMKRRTDAEMLRAYGVIYDVLVSRGMRPKLQRLDNEASAALKQFIQDYDVDYQLVPPYMHRRNAAERAIRTFKNHLIAGLCTTDPQFPMRLWDRLLEQAQITLNLLRTS
jgi:hypothetical protein